MAKTATSRPERSEAQRPRFFTVVPANLGIDFVGLRFRALVFSWLLIAGGFASIYLRGGLNYGIDFAGGTMVHVKFPESRAVSDVRGALDRPELRGVVVQNVGQGGQEFQIRTVAANDEEAMQASEGVKAALKEHFGEGTYDVLRVESVGPKVGRDLWRQATLAVLASTVVMGIYIAARFDFRFGIGAAVALFHDVLITLGAISVANVEFDLSTVAALLTVVGYSVNDTVVISDRIRENMRKMRRESLATVMNLSINETLSRTLITGGTAIAVLLVLIALGGSVIYSFAFTMLFGFVIGTYSSIFVASPIVLYLERRKTARA
jgi:preprotein translocase subunit SecF